MRERWRDNVAVLRRTRWGMPLLVAAYVLALGGIALAIVSWVWPIRGIVGAFALLPMGVGSVLLSWLNLRIQRERAQQ